MSRSLQSLRSLKSKQQHALSLFADGQFGNVCKVLTSDGVRGADPESIREMPAKRPAAKAAVDLSDFAVARPGDGRDITMDVVSAALTSFPCGSGAGPSSFCPQHVLDACRSAHCDEVKTHLTAVCNLGARGNRPS